MLGNFHGISFALLAKLLGDLVFAVHVLRSPADGIVELPEGDDFWPWAGGGGAWPWTQKKHWNEVIDVRYGNEHVKQKADVYWPTGNQQPVDGWSAVIIVHGIGMSKGSFKGLCTEYIVPTGRLCVSGEYRRDDDFRTQDVYALTQWFYGVAGSFNVSRQNIVLSGFSLGGLSINNFLWDPDMGKDLLQGDSPKVRAVMLLSGTWSCHIHQAARAEYFPMSTFIMSSTTDTTVPFSFSKGLADQLESMGKPVKFVAIEKAGHSIMSSHAREQWFHEIQTFLDETVPGAR